MGGPFQEVAYPALGVGDFVPWGQFQVSAHHGGKTIVIGDVRDVMLSIGLPTS